MTIVYVGENFPPKDFLEDYEHMQYYRDLYEGNHKDIFPRANELASSESVNVKLKKTDYRYMRKLRAKKTVDRATHYVMVNLSSSIAELPADLINRSLGNISADEEVNTELLTFITAVDKASGTKSKLWAAIVQHQVDGAVAYRVRRSETKGVWFEWILADLYFEHEDGLGADIAWIEEYSEKEVYLRVERQRLEGDQLTLTQMIFLMNEAKVEAELDFAEVMRERGIEEEAIHVIEDAQELMCGFVTNDDTLLRPRGRSALRNIDVIQEEINWTITRDSIVFEKHGKPKLAIPRKLWDTVANQNNTNYGGRFVRNADLEVVSYDENNGAVPMYITWDAQTKQSFAHVSRLIDYMLAVSKTAPTAVGLGSTGGTLSAKAILYEWIQSVIKSESIREQFDVALKDAFRKSIILENSLGKKSFTVSDPLIEWADLLPKAVSESDEEEAKKYTDKVQSLEMTVRNMHPDWSEKAILAEVEKIQDEQLVDTLNPTFTQPPRTTIGGK